MQESSAFYVHHEQFYCCVNGGLWPCAGFGLLLCLFGKSEAFGGLYDIQTQWKTKLAAIGSWSIATQFLVKYFLFRPGLHEWRENLALVYL